MAIASIINTKDLNKAEAIILSAGYCHSFTYRSGAEKGPKEVIRCLHGNLEFFDRFTLNEPVHINRTGHYNLKGINRLTSEKMVKTISDFYTQYKSKFILLLGGDHSISIGPFSFFSNFRDSSKITILQIDAHPDLRNDTLDYQKTSDRFSHACVMRRACEMGFKTVQVGIRTYSIYDREFITKNNLKIFEWGKEKEHSIDDILSSIETENVYLTVDVDGIDPAHTPATGTPIPGGLEWHFTRRLIRNLILNKNLIGADIVEVSPVKDDVLTQYSAAQLAYDIISYKLLKDKGMLKFYD